MELKAYQQTALKRLQDYLEALGRWRAKKVKAAAVDAELAAALDVPLKAWEEIGRQNYRSRKTGAGEALPNFCLKIPTGGGKTLLAAHAIDLINRLWRRKQSGLVLWVMPTTQIYRQTLASLRDRDHPYRQVLDIASGGRTVVCEKTDRFTPEDVTENLVVLTLMLPSASRQNKETLRMFRDSGGFGAFFPGDDDVQGHDALLRRLPNLNAFGEGDGLFQRQVKTSLGNTLRLLAPVIILDEGHKAYSETAQDTLRGLNPAMIVELSATPAEASNVLVEITGLDLKKEDMIKLDLHVTNKDSTRWQDTMMASKERRDALEAAARAHEANTGTRIRPICLVQVERTGKDQRGGNLIHAEDVREFLVRDCGIAADEVAVKSSERDDIEGLDLFAPGCPVRYIITKQALQEGWDCSFAYVLTILTSPSSKNSLTQLVGRILRQPYARKTKIAALDESYVFCFRQSATKLLESVRAGFGQEGLGDLAGHVVLDEGDSGRSNGEELVGLREQFKKYAGTIYLPKFVIKRGPKWRELSYEADILSLIDWTKADFSAEKELQLVEVKSADLSIAIGLSESRALVAEERGREYRASTQTADLVFATRQLVEAMSNPWIAHDTAAGVVAALTRKYGADVVANNFVHIVQELVKRALAERDRLAEEVFDSLVQEKKLRFLLLRDTEGDGYRLPSKITLRKGAKKLTREDNAPLQLSLFAQVPEDSVNGEERSVAWFFERQGRLLWWYRNLSRQDYRIQGWRKHGIYPDFIASQAKVSDATDFGTVFVLESKGIHLKGNDDTAYKEKVFTLCNRLAEQRSWTELGLEFPERKFCFKLIYGDEWQKRLNEAFGS